MRDVKFKIKRVENRWRENVEIIKKIINYRDGDSVTLTVSVSSGKDRYDLHVDGRPGSRLSSVRSEPKSAETPRKISVRRYSVTDRGGKNRRNDRRMRNQKRTRITKKKKKF